MARRTAPGSRGIVIGGDNYGIASTGNRATLVQVQLVGGAAEICDVRDLVARELPVLGTLAEDEPVGRGEVIGRAVAELAAGVSVQLHGVAGSGRKAIARAVIRRLGAGQVRGVALLPLGEPHTLEGLYQRLANAFFGVLIASPPEEILAAAADQLTGVVFIGDCDLPPGDVTRLLATFPRCTFLLTSEHPTIGRAGAALEVEPLAEAAAVELIAQEIRGEPAGLARLPLEQAYRLSGGQPQRLLQYAAFLASASRLGYPAHTLVTPQAAASILASGLSEPARRILVALATFGELAPEYFAAATGLPAGPEDWAALFQAVPELLSARLVTLTSAGYRITSEAAAAVRAHHWEPARPDVAAQGLLPYLTGDRSASVPPSCAMLLSVARDLVTGGQDMMASRFIRAAAPAALAAGQIRAWAQLIALGVPAALAAGASADLQYFLQEEHTRARLDGDKAALAAVLVLPAQHTTQSQPPQPAPHPPSPRGIRPHFASRARATLTAHHGATIIVTTAVVAAAAIVTATTLTSTPAVASPQAVVTGYFNDLLAGDWAAACSAMHIPPQAQASCQKISGTKLATGHVTVGEPVIDGVYALVPVTGHVCLSSDFGSKCWTNTNSRLGMPTSISPFGVAYDRAAQATSGFSPVPCLDVGGKWYIYGIYGTYTHLV